MSTRTDLIQRLFSWGVALALLIVSSDTKKIPAQAVALKAVPANAWPDEQFENWVFNSHGNSKTARQKFDSLLKLRIEEIDGHCRLTEEQKQKFRLMGAGEIKRIFDSFEKAKREFKLLNNDVQKLNEIMPVIQPIQEAQQRLFQDGSLLAKSLNHTLTKEQFARYEAVDRERREFQHRAQIELAVHSAEEAMPLRDAQRRELIALLSKELKPVRTASPYRFYILMYRMSQLPEAKIKPLFSDSQWQLWEKHMTTYKDLLKNWRQAGIVLDDEDFADPKAEEPK